MAQPAVRTISSLGSALTDAFIPAAEAAVGAVTGSSSRSLSSSSGSQSSSSVSQGKNTSSTTDYTAPANILEVQAKLSAQEAAAKARSDNNTSGPNYEQIALQEDFDNFLREDPEIQSEFNIRWFLETLGISPSSISSRTIRSGVLKSGYQKKHYTTTIELASPMSRLNWPKKLTELCEKYFGKALRHGRMLVVSPCQHVKITHDAKQKYLRLKKSCEEEKKQDACNKLIEAKQEYENLRRKLIDFANNTLDKTKPDYVKDEIIKKWDPKKKDSIDINEGEIVRDQILNTTTAALLLFELLDTAPNFSLLKTDQITNIEVMIQKAIEKMDHVILGRTGVEVLNAALNERLKYIQENVFSLFDALAKNPNAKAKILLASLLRDSVYMMKSRFLHGQGMRMDIIEEKNPFQAEHPYELHEARDALVFTIREYFRKLIDTTTKRKRLTAQQKVNQEAKRETLKSTLKDVFTLEFLESIFLALNNAFSNGIFLLKTKNTAMLEYTRSWPKVMKEFLGKKSGTILTKDEIKKHWIEHLTKEGTFTDKEAGAMFDLRYNFAESFSNSVKAIFKQNTKKEVSAAQNEFLTIFSKHLKNNVTGNISVGGGRNLPFELVRTNWQKEELSPSQELILEGLLNAFMGYAYTPLPSQLNCTGSANDPSNTAAINNDPINMNQMNNNIGILGGKELTQRVYVMGRFPANIPIQPNVLFLKYPQPNDYKLLRMCPITQEDIEQVKNAQTLLEFILTLETFDLTQEELVELSNTIDYANINTKMREADNNIIKGALLLEKAALLKELGMSNSNSNTYPIEYLRKLQKAKQNKNSSTNDPSMSPNSGNQSNTLNDPQIILPPRFNGNDPGMPEPNRRGIARNYTRTPIRRTPKGFARTIVDAGIPKGPNDPQALRTGGRRTQKHKHRKGKKRSTKRR